mmetsp:Transcript_21121/g.47704  ORF Transcript_21121/g.47704 Transcript_21121/m.47704 type:complete len:444 (-) Transcript_21121:722-2053(-)|eukprot:CAMPEP_0201120490 /NCGR_PEP_ID=MMETSP0850-20130426/4552_1 /ASSEMBLY_ACC=CAM_ASM_000622 /TAXON_ID=183588 /ORGANISM="Pseudo-nitzschia fraudulenta, Strain WWA7" /LENGTH=443 /DNA_ID=CAMNT_0047386659 /DNA_START=191 /DNA_END=1522 /DNA_ORIENTATION=+
MAIQQKNRQHRPKEQETATPGEDKTPRFYKLSAAELPDDLYRKDASARDWIGNYNDGNGNDTTEPLLLPPWMETTRDPKGFEPGALARVVPIERRVDLERCIGIPMYMVANVSPIVVPLFALLRQATGRDAFGHVAILVAAYHFVLFVAWRLVFVPMWAGHPHQNLRDTTDPGDPLKSQYLFTERNVTKYCSTTYVWPGSMQRPALEDTPVIYCVIPHGLVPYGIVGYPYFSKVWNSRLCSWTCVPFLLKLPIVSKYLNAFGYVPAKSKPILEALTKKDRNIGIVLDGIDGMFQNSTGGGREFGAIARRKGIAKIALKAGVPLVPVYGFGHTTIYDVVVDPFGILRYLSARFQVSLTPFFGRWGWFMGPPKRDVPVSMCFGDPIYPPATTPGEHGGSPAAITQKQIDDHHARLLEGFSEVFETHKRGYYGEPLAAKKQLVFVD